MRRIVEPLKIKKVQWAHEYHDTDQDGISNYRDCNPWNPYEQHRRPSETMRRRLMKLNIYVTDELPLKKGYKKYRLMSKEAKKYALQAVKEFYEKIKWHPGIVGEMERNRYLIYVYSSFTSNVHPLGRYDIEQKEISTIKQASYHIDKKEKSKKSAWYDLEKYPDLRIEHLETIKRTPFSSEGISTVSKKQKRKGSETFFHEMGHHYHLKELGINKYKKLRSEEKKNIDFFRPSEIRARRYATKKLDEREKKKRVSHKSYKKILWLN